MDAGANWSDCSGTDELRVPQLLLGLLAEPECRAALLLARFGIDERAVRQKFPQFQPAARAEPPAATRFATETWSCLDTAQRLLIDYPQPLTLATEHLLLGIAATPGIASDWLAECGLYADALEAEVHRLSNHEPGPLPLDFAEHETFVRVLDGSADELPDAPRHEPDDERAGSFAEPVGEVIGEPIVMESEGRSALDAGQFPFAMSHSPGGELTAADELAALRVVDAAANRAGEGLRVIEDFVRFALDDRHLTALCKQARHDLTAALATIPAGERHAARETRLDVGTAVSLPSEISRVDLAAIVAASFKRTEQSLRSLEEYCKAIAPTAAPRLERLRYAVYTLERAVDITRGSMERLSSVRLYVLIDGQESSASLERLAGQLVEAGVGAIQLRDKRLPDRELLERARALRAATAGSQTLMIANDRPDLALLSGADGVHVGQDELSVKDARRILGPRPLIGVSTHSIEQARQAVLDGANYIGVGPTFPSTTKQFSEFTGLELLSAVASEIRLPAFAIGGITAENLSQVLATGIGRVAVSGAIASADDPGTVAQELIARLQYSK